MFKTKPKTQDGVSETGTIPIKKEVSSTHKKKAITGILCLAMAATILIYLIPKAVDSATDIHDVVVLKNDVQKGSLLSESDVSIQKVKDSSVSDTFVNTVSGVVDKYAAVDLIKGDYVLPEKLWDNNISDTYSNLATGNMTISVTFDTFASSMSGAIKKDDIVSILGILNTGDKDEENSLDASSYRPSSILRSELKYVRVIDVLNEQTGKIVDNSKVSVNDDATTLSTVTLLVNEQQAKLLVDLEHTGYLHLALAYRGDSNTAAAYLKEQQSYLDTLASMEQPSDEGDSQEAETETTGGDTNG